MGKWIVALALTGWAGIVWLAYSLADARIGLCHYSETSCIVRTTAARDSVLTFGLAVALGFVILTLIVVAARGRREAGATGWMPTRRASRTRLR